MTDRPSTPKSQRLDLCNFCGSDNYREYLNKPFQVGLFVAATNGHVMAMHPADPGLTTIPVNAASLPPRISEAVLKYAQKVASQQFYERQRFTDTVPQVEPTPCEECHGSGKSRRQTCPECDGDGEVEAETDYSTYDGLQCKTCDGEGWVLGCKSEIRDCVVCSGSGKTYKQGQRVSIGGAHIQPQYWDLIKDLHGLELCFVTDDLDSYSKSESLGFRQVINGKVISIGLILGMRGD